MGEQALKSHMKGQKHIANSKAVSRFFQPKSMPIMQPEVNDAASCSTSSDSSLRSPTVSTTNQKQLELNFTSNDSPAKRKAEIMWALKCVASDWSASSAEQIYNLFKDMFSDSRIASDFKLSRTKLTYLLILV